jgi:hypothetical protein
MAEDRAAYLAEAYKRGLLPQDMRDAYEQAQQRGIVGVQDNPHVPGADAAIGLGKAAATGAIQGLAPIMGAPRELIEEGAQAFDYKVPEWARNLPNTPTAKNMLEKSPLIELTNQGKYYEPKNLGENMTLTAGKYLPTAAMPGGGGAAARALGVVGPAIGGQIGEAIGNKLPASIAPWAKTAGEFLGPSIVRKTVTPMPANAIRRAETDVLRDAGITHLTAGQRSGRHGMAATEHELKPNIIDPGQKDLVKWATALAGRPTERIDQNWFAEARPAVSRNFETVANRNVLDSSHGNLTKDLTDIVNDFPRGTGLYDDAVNQLANHYTGRVNVLLSKNGGTMSGQDYQKLRSELGQHAFTAPTDKAKVLYRIQNALDNAMEHSIQRTNPNDAGLFGEARERFRALETLTKAVRGDKAAFSQGRVTPEGLSNAADAVYGDRAFVSGYDPFSRVSQAARSVFNTHKGGDPTNWGSPLTTAGNIAGGTAGLVTGGPVNAIIGAWLGGKAGQMAGKVAEKTLSPFVTNPITQGYLGNQILPEGQGMIPAIVRALEAKENARKQ